MQIGMGLRLLETLTSALYEDPIVFFREYVQNSVDAFTNNSANKQQEIHISIDRKSRTIEFLDNGPAIKENLFFEKMTSIGKSDKKKKIDQIGFRGIGRLSAMPFCKELVFENKPEGSSVLQTFSWDGNKYNSLLSKSAEDDLLIAINEITRQHTEIYTGQAEEHFFRVTLLDYSDEIEALINSKDFDFRLKRILPLKYEDSFSAKDVIHKHYREFMGDSLERFEYEVYLDNEKIYKPYDARCILESDIVFWDLSFEKESDEVPGDKIGVLWFTFNRKVTTNSENTPRGIYVRSKNMMLGNEYAIADSMTRLSSDYVATYRELTQTLNGVYGELLIDTERLSDNARRDWFKIDKSSNELKIILTDFLRKLKAYRYAASKAFNHKQDKTKKQVIEAYRNLTGGFNVAEFEKNFTDMTPEPVTEKIFLYADDDIPRHSMTSKKFYETIIIALRQYCLENKGDDGIDELIKIRTFLKKYLNE